MRQLRTEQRALDVVLAAAVLLAGLWRDVLRDGPEPDFLLPVPDGAVGAVHLVAAVVLVALRRRQPYLCAAALAALAVVVPTYAALVAPYSVARYGPRLVTSLGWCAALVLGWGIGADLWTDGEPFSAALFAAAATACGLYAGARAQALTELARQEELAARARERRRVAGDLHDAVTHWVTLIVMQSGALSVRTSDPALKGELETVRGHGVRAMAELQRMVSVLADPASVTDGPVAEDQPLEEVVGQALTAGQPVTLHRSGPALPAGDRLWAVLVRATREALANARRHAPGSAVAVHLAVRAGSVRLLVRNATCPAGTPAASRHTAVPAGSGTGLADLSATVARHDGSMRAAPTREGGFELDVRLPRPRGRVGEP